MEIIRHAKDTLTVVELNHGDILRFRLRSGQERCLQLLFTKADVLFTNLEIPKIKRRGGVTLYRFCAHVLLDGHPLTLERYVGSQESFYEPYVLNGMRLWFDAVADVFELIDEAHGACKPSRAARFALNDALDRICPVELKSWLPRDAKAIDIAECYNGDDCWLGAYMGADAHGGLDINHARHAGICAPIDIDDHCFFNSLAAGDNNNRWRGWHSWPNGDTWILQCHHILHLLVPEHVPIPAGAQYAEGAGVLVGDHEHSHFVFRVAASERDQNDPSDVYIDPWVLFWQTFEDRKARDGSIRACIQPLRPGRTGQAITFSSKGSRMGQNGQRFSYFWTFGDHGYSCDSHPRHVFTKPGVYPITLVVDDGAETATFTQHITVDGEPVAEPGLALMAEDEFTFRLRPRQAMDVYGTNVRFLPHTLYFTARSSRPRPNTRVVRLLNVGGGLLPTSQVDVAYENGQGWLEVESVGTGNEQSLRVGVDMTGLPSGRYRAYVSVTCPDVINATQKFNVYLLVPPQAPVYKELQNLKRHLIDDHHARFYATPYFWIGHKVLGAAQGVGGFHLTNGARVGKGEFARFTPDLAAGKYEVRLADETPFDAETAFNVRIRHRLGDELARVQPAIDRLIGVFDFTEGTDGFVEILAEDSCGQVLIDAVIFTPCSLSGHV